MITRIPAGDVLHDVDHDGATLETSTVQDNQKETIFPLQRITVEVFTSGVHLHR